MNLEQENLAINLEIAHSDGRLLQVSKNFAPMVSRVPGT
jgi:hypothetical protein